MSLVIAIEGTDASGKKTQSDLLAQAVRKMGLEVTELSFPDYDSPSSALVKMYLGGDFGSNPEDTGAYAASSFFAVDRYASFKMNWEKVYNDSKSVIILNRYTTSNAVHQLAKIEDDAQKDAFLGWLYDFEFVKLGLPVPDGVFYLDMPLEASVKLLEARSEQTGVKKDIHEADTSHLAKARRAGAYVTKKWGWIRIACGEGDKPFSREYIHEQVLENVKRLLKNKGIV